MRKGTREANVPYSAAVDIRTPKPFSPAQDSTILGARGGFALDLLSDRHLGLPPDTNFRTMYLILDESYAIVDVFNTHRVVGDDGESEYYSTPNQNLFQINGYQTRA